MQAKNRLLQAATVDGISAGGYPQEGPREQTIPDVWEDESTDGQFETSQMEDIGNFLLSIS